MAICAGATSSLSSGCSPGSVPVVAVGSLPFCGWCSRRMARAGGARIVRARSSSRSQARSVTSQACGRCQRAATSERLNRSAERARPAIHAVRWRAGAAAVGASGSRWRALRGASATPVKWAPPVRWNWR